MGAVRYPSVAENHIDPYSAKEGDVWVRNRDFTCEAHWQDAIAKARRNGLVLRQTNGYTYTLVRVK